jgi:hypothetical protein
MPVAVFTQTTTSAGQCFLAAISVAKSSALSAKADMMLGLGIESKTISKVIDFRTNSLQSMKFTQKHTQSVTYEGWERKLVGRD